MPRPVIALLTDFGARDHYVGAMKGVMLGICREAAIVDITHEIPPQDVMGGALELAACFRFFPPGTIFLAVVDPGVGSTRRAVAVDAGGFRFVAPDNGILSLALDAAEPSRMVELSAPEYARPTISRTFEGRDRFAPAAAWLACGVELAALGPAVPAIVRLAAPRPEREADRIRGEVIRVDRFGNLITNIPRDALAALGAPGTLVVRIGRAEVSGVVGTYTDVASGSLCALVGSTDRLEIAVHGGSAAAVLNVERGAAVHLFCRA